MPSGKPLSVMTSIRGPRGLGKEDDAYNGAPNGRKDEFTVSFVSFGKEHEGFAEEQVFIRG